MANKAKLTFKDGYSAFSDAFLFGWESILDFILRGALDVKTSGNKTTFTELWSNTEMVVTAKGNKLSKIEITGDTLVDGQRERAEFFELQMEDGPPRLNSVVNAFEQYHETSSLSGEVAAFLSGFETEQITRENIQVPRDLFDVGAVLRGSSAKDVFRLNDGLHSILASAGNDRIIGGDGFDSVNYSLLTGSGGITVRKSGSNFKVDKPGNDTDTISKIDGIFGTDSADVINVALGNKNLDLNGRGGADKLKGGKGDDYISGGGGRDTLEGGGGNDVLSGDGGADRIKGNGGDDILIAASAAGSLFTGDADKLTGGGGSDLFVIEKSSVPGAVVEITDFKNGTDFIGLVGQDPLTGFALENLVFSQLDFKNQNGGTMISADGQDVAFVEDVSKGAFNRKDFVESVDITLTLAIGQIDDFLFF